MTGNTVLEGGCLCGAIRYRATATPFAADYCHCSICRKSTGSPFGVWMDFKAGQVEWSNARPHEYASSEHIRRGFCRDCGTSLTYRHQGHPEYLTISIASLDDPDAVKPTYHIHTNSQIGWLKIDDDLQRYPEGGSPE